MFTPDYRTLILLAAVMLVAIFGALSSFWRGGDQSAGSGDPTLRRLATAAWFLSCEVWFLLIFGSSVRVNGAGLACPDWPACFGQVVPAMDWGIALEWGHRAVAAVISILFAGLLWSIARRPDLRRDVVPWAVAAGCALSVQVILGGLTVLHLLAEWTVSSHLLVGNAFSAMVSIVALRLSERVRPVQREGVRPVLRRLAGLLLALVAVQIFLGGWVSSSHAGLVCPNWPECRENSFFPQWSGLVGLHLVHRLTAYALLALAIVVAYLSWSNARIRRYACGVVGVVVAQAVLGVANVMLRLPVEVTLLHSAGAASLVLAAAWLFDELCRSPVVASSPIRSDRSLSSDFSRSNLSHPPNSQPVASEWR